MDYVMVPVPEELAKQVGYYIRYTLNLPRAHDDESLEAVTKAYHQSDPLGRELLELVADAVGDCRDAVLSESAAALDCTEPELVGKAQELGYLSFTLGGPLVLLMCTPPDDDEPDSAVAWRTRSWVMRDEVAALIRRAKAATGPSVSHQRRK